MRDLENNQGRYQFTRDKRGKQIRLKKGGRYMCAPCKVIINNGLAGVVKGLEQVITSPHLSPKLTDQERYDLTQDLLNIDLCAYNGGTVKKGVRDLIKELRDRNVIDTDDIWKVLA